VALNAILLPLCHQASKKGLEKRQLPITVLEIRLPGKSSLLFESRQESNAKESNLVLAREVEEVELLALLPWSETIQLRPEEEVQRVEVEEEPMRTILVLARIRRTWAHIG
jgi:hypothetical protein